ncbi:bifunctional glutamate N-acetyltransferase/amino-acid acetyltransferase ArgJ [Marinoscillum sp. MHG1-6]|uniref:bifunctional glutamate N-acetyltransferase/amino-acid acetyltransferase ArgJ n=1 Tax=Marinoscillum sp. MHG1-6 TaxID=2959627 RepID=UPI0021577E97|nr:bifunctional glutamate N-acetyltransferase/amino-acid acetyltransferase ArgJ [Marinoscillum sp. MHG1-6]
MIQNITNVRGIKCWGAHTGVKSMRRDLAIFVSEVPAKVSATFTQNLVVAEPIKVSKKNLKEGKHLAKALVVNAGNANAVTGQQGREGAEAMVRAAAEELDVPENQILVASTGIIGQEFPTEAIVDGIKENMKKVTDNSRAGSFAANAILTTDTFPKEGFVEFEIDGKTIHIGGIAKGSGMIHPNMATMLSFAFTDVNISQKLLDKAFKEAVDDSFNMITVDGDTSTNDMASVMANGLAENKLIEDEKDKNYALFRDKLKELMIHLAKLIVSDGEGASKFIEYKVTDAKSEKEARQLIRVVSDSSLVKTAMFGRDPNWGRILAAMGRAGVKFNPDKVDLYLGTGKNMVKLLDQGTPVEQEVYVMKRILKSADINVHIKLNNGKEEAVGWGTDLTTDYVMFNSVYTT